jgi:hypothetical protein
LLLALPAAMPVAAAAFCGISAYASRGPDSAGSSVDLAAAPTLPATPIPTPAPPTDARATIAAGADLILGSHSHWVGPFEQITPGHFVFYSLGDLVFDWTHDERTQEASLPN